MVLITSSAIIAILPTGHASPTSDLLYASPGYTTTLPTGSTFSIAIKVANFEAFNGWDIHVRTDPSVLSPVSLTINSNIFAANFSSDIPFTVADCLNGAGMVGDCGHDPYGGSGVVWSAVSYIGAPASGYGSLFNITYSVQSAGFSSINILHDAITSGSGTTGIPHTTLGGSYGTYVPHPDFSIESNPASLTLTLASSGNVSQTSVMTLSSFDNFTGTANIAAYSSLQSTINPKQVFLPKNGTATSTITVWANSSTISTQYFVNITAVIGSTRHSQLMTVQVNPIPDFLMSVSPSLLKIHATNSGSSIITLDTESGYSGGVHLRMDVPQVPGLIASLGATDFNISPGNPAAAVFAVRTPASAYPFKYLINITASSSQSIHVPFTITVRPPGSDFNFQIGAPGFVVQAGRSLTVTLNATSVDYFRGQLFFLASSFSGIKSVFTRPSVALDYGLGSNAISKIDYGNSSSSQMTITTDPNLSLGNHNINVTTLGTTFLGVPVNHSVIITVTVIPTPSTAMILGLQPVAYFGIIGVLWLGLLGVAVREIRRPKPKRFLT